MAKFDKPKSILFDLGSTILKNESYDLEAGFRHLLNLSQGILSVDPCEFISAALELDQAIMSNRTESAFEFHIHSLIRILAEQFNLKYDLPYNELELELWKSTYKYYPSPGVIFHLHSPT